MNCRTNEGGNVIKQEIRPIVSCAGLNRRKVNSSPSPVTFSGAVSYLLWNRIDNNGEKKDKISDENKQLIRPYYVYLPHGIYQHCHE